MTPNREFIENLQVGDIAPDCFGKLSQVTDITFRGTDIHGKKFVGVYLVSGAGKISAAYKEDQEHWTIFKNFAS